MTAVLFCSVWRFYDCCPRGGPFCAPSLLLDYTVALVIIMVLYCAVVKKTLVVSSYHNHRVVISSDAALVMIL